jgi:choline dehydrogenase-like flavoprotein
LKSHTLTKPSAAAAEHLRINWINDSAHGHGPVEATFAEETENPLPAAWMDTISKLGYPPSADPFTGTMTGVYANPMTIDSVNRERTDSVTAYYRHAQSRSNLKVATGAVVQKIIFETRNGKPTATGVQVKLSDGTTATYTAKKEVILAAGAVGSPKVLELSGVGDKKLLTKYGIPVVYDNRNVGENLQDHVNTGFSYEVIDGVETLDPIARGEPEALAAAQEAYATNKSGPFSVGGNYIGSLLPLPDFTEGPEAKKTLKKVIDQSSAGPSTNTSPFAPYHAKFVHKILGDKHESSVNSFGYAAYGEFIARPDGNTGVNASEGHNFFTLVVAPAYPLSLGSTHIASADPEVGSTIDPRYLTHPLDQEVMARHLRYLGKIAESEPLSKLFKPGGERNYGAPEDLNDLEALKAYARKGALTNYHLTSSCAMLPLERGGVVDPQLSVYGVKGVRVVDSSVIPLSAKGNPQSTVYAVAEKAADIIKKSYGLA